MSVCAHRHIDCVRRETIFTSSIDSHATVQHATNASVNVEFLALVNMPHATSTIRLRKLFVKYTIMPLMQKLLNAFPSGLLKLRLGLRDQMDIFTFLQSYSNAAEIFRSEFAMLLRCGGRFLQYIYNLFVLY
ncbi:hypothetical protein X777_06995, partial [Ooceraea biroi]